MALCGKITAFNPQGTRVTGFGVPTEEELRHDYLWRIAATPGTGRIGVFNRSHYEDVLVVRVNELVPKSVWKHRYDQINDFESTLAANDTRIVKLYLHISRDEQRERFLKRLADPEKQWKWSSADLEAREKWKDYRAAYTDALTRCSTDHAPWFIVPADHKWYRDVAAAEIMVEAARKMDPKWPESGRGPLEGRHPRVTRARIHAHEAPMDRHCGPRGHAAARRLPAGHRWGRRGLGLCRSRWDDDERRAGGELNALFDGRLLSQGP